MSLFDRKAALDPQLEQFVRHVTTWEEVYKKDHPEAATLLSTMALDEKDDTKAKAWLETYTQKLGAEIAQEVDRRLVILSASLAEMSTLHSECHTDELVAKGLSWILKAGTFQQERKMSDFRDLERLSQEILDLYQKKQ